MKKHLANISLILGSCIIVAVIAEIIIRTTNIAYEPQYDNRVKITRKSSNPMIKYELIPNYDGMALGGHVIVNAHGMRGPEVSQLKPDGVKRIAVLGDSWAFGWGVDQDEVFAAILEKKLNSQYPGQKFEVLNFALYGYNFQQQEAVLISKVLAFNPDVVLFAFNINDLEDLNLRGLEKTPEEGLSQKKETEGTERKKNIEANDVMYSAFREIEGLGNQYSHLFRLVDNMIRSLAIQFNMKKPGKELYFKKFYEDEAPEFLFLKNVFSKIRALSIKHEFDTWIIYFPWMNELAQENPYEETFGKVKVIAEREGFLTLNLFRYFMGKDVNELRISKIDGHPTALGHKIAADAIMNFILSNTKAKYRLSTVQQ